jgi:hypothetical protein
VASGALIYWKGTRAQDLDDLVRAHRLLGGTGPGRRWTTRQINRSLVIALASEFQGFCRELHDEGAQVLAEWSALQNASLRIALLQAMTSDRQLDRVNAQTQSIGQDFSRFGMPDWWAALRRRDARTESRRLLLERLNQARNAIAHAEEGKLQRLSNDGYPVKLTMFRKWRQALNGLAVTMDMELGATLGAVFGRRPPW